jgi:hypothetical protein
MASDTERASSSNPHRTVRADSLAPVEPDYGREFVLRPDSLTPAELGGLPATLAGEPTRVLAWVRHAAAADHVRALALAWTPRAVYVEWEDRGTHRAWVWASAVERAPASQEAAAPPEQPRASVLAVMSTEPLVHLVNLQLALVGAEFVTAMAKPIGPFGAVVFGAIDGHSVRLDFSTEPATGMCVVALVSKKEALPDRSAAPTFERAIETYSWDAAIDVLGTPDAH